MDDRGTNRKTEYRYNCNTEIKVGNFILLKDVFWDIGRKKFTSFCFSFRF